MKTLLIEGIRKALILMVNLAVMFGGCNWAGNGYVLADQIEVNAQKGKSEDPEYHTPLAVKKAKLLSWVARLSYLRRTAVA